MNTKRLLMAAAFAPLALGGAALADTKQGDLSATSSNGEVLITAEVPAMVKVSGLQDMNFGMYDPTTTAINNGFWEDDQSFCVFRNSDAALYKITFDGSVTSGEFSLSGAGGTLPYAVDFSDNYQDAATTWANVTAGIEVTGSQAGENGAIDCSNSNPRMAGLKVKFLETDVQTAFDSSYSGDLLITVQPE